MILPEKDDGVEVGYTTEDRCSRLTVSHRYRNGPVELCLSRNPLIQLRSKLHSNGAHRSVTIRRLSPKRRAGASIHRLHQGQLLSANRFRGAEVPSSCISSGATG